MKKCFVTLASVLCVLAVGMIPAQASTVFINGEVTSATSTPFTDTVNGITASFSGSSDPGAFDTSSTTGTVSWGPEMVVTNSTDSVLTILFSQVLSSVTLDFGTENFTSTPDALNLAASLGGSSAGTSNATGGSDPVAFFEGSLTFNSGNFDKIVLSSDSPIFAVGNITVAADSSAVPEPSSAILLGGGLLLVLLGGVRWSPFRAVKRA
jgi:hypothetical protein